MRPSRITAGLVTAGLVGLVPIAVSAPAEAAPVGSTTTLTLTSAPSTGGAFRFGDALSFSGGTTGADGSSALDGTASLQISTPSAPGYVTVATDTSPSSLFFSGITAQGNATYKVVFSGGNSTRSGNTLNAGESAPVSVAVARTIKATTPGLRVVGTVSPDYAKGKVKILRKDGKKYKRYATVKTNKKSKFTFRAPSKRGFRFAVVIPGDADYAGTYETYRVY